MAKKLLTEDDMRKQLRDLIEALETSQNGLARRMGVSNSHLSRVLSGEKAAGDKVLSWLGLKPVTRYTRTHAFQFDRRSA